MALKKFMIERGIPKVGALDAEQLSGAAAKSNDALCHIGAKDIQWVHSYVTADKTFYVYLASDEGASAWCPIGVGAMNVCNTVCRPVPVVIERLTH